MPLILEGFDFGSLESKKALIGKLALLKNYNGLKIYSEYFDEGMSRLRERYINIALEAVLHPISGPVEKATKEQQNQAKKTKVVKKKELTAQEWLERGYIYFVTENLDEAIRCYTVAVSLAPNDSTNYFTMAFAREVKGDLDGANQDYREVLNLNPNFPDIYINIGRTYDVAGNTIDAEKSYIEAIRRNPESSIARLSLMRLFQKAHRIVEAKEQENIIRELIKNEDEYNQACYESNIGNIDKALNLLQIAFSKRKEPLFKRLARQDPDFENIRDDPRFIELVGE